MHSNALRRGLHIDDEDEKPVYEKQSLDADRKRGNFEKDLDSMLFGGGFGQPPPRRRKQQSAPKPAEQTKPAVTTPSTTKPAENKPAENKSNDKIKPPSPPKIVEVPKQDNKKKPSPPKTVVDSSNVVVKPQINQTPQSNNSNNKSGQKTQPATTNQIKKPEPSIVLPSGGTNTNISLGIESKPNITPVPPVKVDNYVNKTTLNKVQPTKPTVNVPSQPTKQQQVNIEEQIYVVPTNKQVHNKPQFIRKLKKVAQDFKFAEENIIQNNAVDVVRPFETDRSRQRKLNDIDFKDYQFPASSISLGQSNKSLSSSWKKPNQLCKVVNFGKYVDPNDLKPGKLSSPHFLSTLSALAELQINTKRLIEDQKSNSNGFYLVRLFINSVWRYITVDSSLPYIDDENAGVISYPEGQFELSSALIQKAYAKSFGGYDVFSKIEHRENYLRDLTGAPSKIYTLDTPDLANIIKKAIAGNQVVLAVPNQKIAALGLNPNYSLNLINYTSKGSMELRNPWGTIEERPKASINKEGSFELGASLVRDNISHIIVSHVNPAYFTTTIQSKHKFGFYSSYAFKIAHDSHGYMTISQWDQRLFPSNDNYHYSPFRIIIQKENSDGSATFINAGFTSGSRNLDVEVNLTPGKYVVFVAAHWVGKQHNYNLTYYGSERVDFERIYTDKIPNLISQSLESINIEEGRKTEINKNISQYFLYHEHTNLVLVTLQNNTDKQVYASQDFSKVNFDHLALLNAKDNQDNYANKISHEVEEYKHYPHQDRRWNLNLGSHQQFTWILSTDKPFDANNPKVWGFK